MSKLKFHFYCEKSQGSLPGLGNGTQQKCIAIDIGIILMAN